MRRAAEGRLRGSVAPSVTKSRRSLRRAGSAAWVSRGMLFVCELIGPSSALGGDGRRPEYGLTAAAVPEPFSFPIGPRDAPLGREPGEVRRPHAGGVELLPRLIGGTLQGRHIDGARQPAPEGWVDRRQGRGPRHHRGPLPSAGIGGQDPADTFPAERRTRLAWRPGASEALPVPRRGNPPFACAYRHARPFGSLPLPPPTESRSLPWYGTYPLLPPRVFESASREKVLPPSGGRREEGNQRYPLSMSGLIWATFWGVTSPFPVLISSPGIW